MSLSSPRISGSQQQRDSQVTDRVKAPKDNNTPRRPHTGGDPHRHQNLNDRMTASSQLPRTVSPFWQGQPPDQTPARLRSQASTRPASGSDHDPWHSAQSERLYRSR